MHQNKDMGDMGTCAYKFYTNWNAIGHFEKSRALTGLIKFLRTLCMYFDLKPGLENVYEMGKQAK